MNARDIERKATKIISQALQDKNPVISECEGQQVASVYLGTVFGLTPSGKIYTPWANSNVKLCPRCRGAGSVKNKNAEPEKAQAIAKETSAKRIECIQKFGAFIEGRWPREVIDELAKQDRLAERLMPTRHCSFCGGLGSREAYEDELFNETLEEIAGEQSGWIEYSDENIYFMRLVEE